MMVNMPPRAARRSIGVFDITVLSSAMRTSLITSAITKLFRIGILVVKSGSALTTTEGGALMIVSRRRSKRVDDDNIMMFLFGHLGEKRQTQQTAPYP
jgi:hypothetical protein